MTANDLEPHENSGKLKFQKRNTKKELCHDSGEGLKNAAPIDGEESKIRTSTAGRWTGPHDSSRENRRQEKGTHPWRVFLVQKTR
jgi:hypothetical protein